MKSATLLDLRRAVGRWPWRTADVEATSGKPISEEMTMWLALVIYGGYELFPDRHEH